MMSKEIKDYLHLYLGCEAMDKDGHKLKLQSAGVGGNFRFVAQTEGTRRISMGHCGDIKPILRTLSGMTKQEEEEWKEIRFNQDFKLKRLYTDADYNSFHYLLSKHFDLFGLIEAGLAIDKTTL